MSAACDNFILEDQSCEWFELVQYVESFDMGINFLEGPPGPPGPAGEAIFIPSVSEDGVLSWTNTAGLPNPDPIDLSGPAGTTDYNDLTNKPSINGVTLDGNKTTAELMIRFSAADVGLGNVANERQYSAQNPPPYPVKSVNGQTGDVTVQPATDAQVATAVNAWLGNNVDPETGYVLDTTLTMSNAAAPASAVGVLKNEINNVLYLNDPTFEQYKSLAVVGGMSQGNVNPSQTWRVSIDSLLSFPYDTRVYIASGYQIAFHVFENGVFAYDSGWQETAYAIPANTTFKCTINKKNSYSDADIATFLSQVSIDYPLFRENVPSVIPYNEVLRDYALETQIQDAIIADGMLYQFTGAATEVSGYAGHIIRVNLSTFELSDNVYHRLGHVTCLGYCKQNDTLFSGRVIDSVPKIQIYKGFVSAAIEGAVLSPEDANCITINLSSSLLDSRTSFDVTLGEHKNILYGYCTVLSETNNIVLLYKILLGTGSVDLSAETDGYGSLISAADGEYNGTCKIIGTWYLPGVNRQPQLIRWHKGNLYMMTSNHDAIVHKYKFVDNEFTPDELIYINDIDASGSVVNMEAESLEFIDNGAYMTLWDKSTPTKMRLLRVSV